MTEEEQIKHYEKLVLAYAHKHYPVYRNRTSVGIIEVKEDRILFGMRGVQGVLENLSNTHVKLSELKLLKSLMFLLK